MLTLRERLEAEDPRAHAYYVHFPKRADQSVSVYTEGAIDPRTGKPLELDYDEAFIDPYSGRRLGERMWGDFSLQRKDLVAQLYFLHYSLVLPEALGEGLMGFVALVWIFDCFVGLSLTLPTRGRSAAPRAAGERAAAPGFLRRWWQAWRIKARAGRNRLTYDLHRAVSLWVWLLLLMFALSGFAINLPRVYDSAVRHVLPYEDTHVRPELDQPLVEPAIGWHEALRLGQQYMAEQARLEGFSIQRPTALIYRRHLGVYYYRVLSDRDVVTWGRTTVAIDATSGALVGVEIPTGHRAGNTFTSWIMALHMAMVFGWPWKIAVSVMGLVVVLITVTGVLVWWRKRATRRAMHHDSAASASAARGT